MARTFNPLEVAGVGQSYQGLGGLEGTGMDFNTWLQTQGIENKAGQFGLASAPKTSLFGDQGFGFNKGTMKGLGQIGDLASGLAGIYFGNKQLGLAEDKFAFDKDMMTKQYNMAKDAYDRKVKRAENIGAQMQAGKVGG